MNITFIKFCFLFFTALICTCSMNDSHSELFTKGTHLAKEGKTKKAYKLFKETFEKQIIIE